MERFPTLLRLPATTTLVKERLLTGMGRAQAGGLTYKVHLDGYILPYLEGKEPKSPRMSITTSTTMASSWRCGMRSGKFVFSRAAGSAEPEYLAKPVHASGSRRCSISGWDPYERADITSDQYNDWLVKRYLTAPRLR